jgi:ankyrin repeat protein
MGQCETARCLLGVGGADPTLRHELTQWVPLHEAAWRGHLDCVAVLLDYFSPVRPRTPKVGTEISQRVKRENVFPSQGWKLGDRRVGTAVPAPFSVIVSLRLL